MAEISTGGGVLNHYPHHIGDYLKDTAHLDLIEDGIYRRLLDLYYTLEGPIEANTAPLCRRLRLDVKKYGDVVERLLAEFFVLNGAGTHWHHSRCDDEIAKYQAKADANRRNGKAGGRPKQTDEKPKNNPDGFQDVTQKNLNQNQNQNQNHLKEKPERDKPAVILPEGMDLEVWQAFLALRKAKKAPVSQLVVDGIRREAAKAGITLEAALRMCCERGWQSLKSDWVKTESGAANGKFNVHAAGRKMLADALAAEALGAGPTQEVRPALHAEIYERIPGSGNGS